MPGSSQPSAMAPVRARARGARARAPAATSGDKAPSGAPRRLSLVGDPPATAGGASPPAGTSSPAERPASVRPAERVLIAGADPQARERMLAELRSLLPAGTDFVQAGETWEVVARAADSRMVVLTGDLGDVSSDSLLRLLARRNPSLPVLAVGRERLLRPPARARGSAGREHGQAVDAARA